MRSVSQIYSEAVSVRNNYLQLTELNAGRSNSKLSILNLITYVVAVCIHTYEAVLDLFQVRIAEVLNGRINGTPDWYAMISKKFQYDSATGVGDALVFNEDTLKIEYEKPNPSHRIIEKSAWQTDGKTGTLTLKVCKANTNSNEINNGVPYMQLDSNELVAFKLFIQQIKFVGAIINCESSPGDIVTITADSLNPIYYDDAYVTESQAMKELHQSMIDFANEFKFNDMLYYQSIIDAIRKTKHIAEVGKTIKVNVRSYNHTTKQYDPPVELSSRTRLKSGYIRFIDENSIVTINKTNITLTPASKMGELIIQQKL